MIDDQTKQKLLDELEKTGNVWSSCAKLNIHRSTVYRWRDDKQFRRVMDKAVRVGRDNMNDFTEHALMTNVKKCIQRAIEFYLVHRHPAYKQKRNSYVLFDYKKNLPPSEKAITVEELEAAANGDFIVLDENETDSSKGQNHKQPGANL
jgi:hypothetical protein